MGIFQACVYLLGPKTNFGQSEQNPGFWLVLLLASKKNGARILWDNPIKDPSFSKNPGTLRDTNGNLILDGSGNPKLYHQKILDHNDFTMWRRFFMSYLVNGVAFHILVHALPIQVASQSSFTGVVFRAVGMLYLVDLDDSKGFRLIITEKDEAAEKKDEEKKESSPEDDDKKDEEEMRPPGKHTPMKIDSAGNVTPVLETQASQQAMEAEANEILEEAQQKLEMLRQSGPSTRTSLGGKQGSAKTNRLLNRPGQIANASSRLNIGFGCSAPISNAPRQSMVVGDDKATKKNTGQAALLQASTEGAFGGDDGGDGGGDGGGGGGE